jgi:hypothetical protein
MGPVYGLNDKSRRMPMVACMTTTKDNRKGRRKKKEPGTKTSFHGCSIASWQRNEYFNVFGILSRVDTN